MVAMHAHAGMLSAWYDQYNIMRRYQIVTSSQSAMPNVYAVVKYRCLFQLGNSTSQEMLLPLRAQGL